MIDDGRPTTFEQALALFNTGGRPPESPHGFTPRAIRLFQLVKRTLRRCTCVQPTFFVNDQNLWEQRTCAACRAVIELQYDLCRELKLPVWEDTAVVPPDARNPYPPGCDRNERWEPDAESQRRWRELDTALVDAS